ncbi:protein ENHANCED PSEUDOMONAS SUSCEPTIBILITY 1-like [Amaranthus tricolor]|uniref:protein ENHANCED PSEUDOMONAS SUSCEPTIBILITY 1-like n=1 Tax=Amaranthus tricolor TaxID=29722 RepID=UPI00258298EE|nr:protein ENHANCED PSEUDOMONAS SUSCEPTIBILITY 1-like [Amaranthus tricolor]
MNSAKVKHNSEWFIKPKNEVQAAKKPYYLAPMDLAMLSVHYIQKGLLFKKPTNLDDQPFSIHKLIATLRDSLSLTLVHFYPLAGRLATQVDEDQQRCLVFVDCAKGPGARFTYATLDMSISDILSPTDVPVVVQSFFDHDRAVNHDGHDMSLLTIQVTELVDGIFIGCSMNHSLGDGTSYWHFWNMWSEIHMAKHPDSASLSRMPILTRWFPDGYNPPIFLPYTRPDQFITRFEASPLRERIFHFSSESIARLKSKANKQNNDNKTNKISSFQALSALCWRSIVRANRLPLNQITNCRLAINNRHRLNPPLPQDYFGNCINAMKSSSTVRQLLDHNLGWAADLLHQSVANQSNEVVREFVSGWMQNPCVYQLEKLFDSNSVMMGSSPRFDMYGNEFGFGKAVALHSGYANKFVGKVTAYPGYEGGSSVDLEICLPPDSMNALETDQEFMDAVVL